MKQIQDVRNRNAMSNVRIFVFGSLIGGTGSSLLPLIGGLIEEAFRDLKITGASFACALAESFFESVFREDIPEDVLRNQRLSLHFLKSGLLTDRLHVHHWSEFMVANAVLNEPLERLLNMCAIQLKRRWIFGDLSYNEKSSVQFSNLHETEDGQIPLHLYLHDKAVMPKVFICYAREDRTLALDLYDKLRARGFVPWIDIHDLSPGDDWDRAIRKAISETDFVLVCLSRNSIGKRGYVQREIRVALECFNDVPLGKAYLIPVRLEYCEPASELAMYQFADVFERGGENKLFASLLKHWKPGQG